MCCDTEPAAASDHFSLSKRDNHACCKRRRKVSLWPPWNSFRAPETQTHYVKDRNVRYWGKHISSFFEEQPKRHPKIFPTWMCCDTEPAAASDHFSLSKRDNHACCKRRRKVSLEAKDPQDIFSWYAYSSCDKVPHMHTTYNCTSLLVIIL